MILKGLRKVEKPKVGDRVCGMDTFMEKYRGTIVRIFPRLKHLYIVRDDNENNGYRYKGVEIWFVEIRDDNKYYGAENDENYLYHERIEWKKRLL